MTSCRSRSAAPAHALSMMVCGWIAACAGADGAAPSAASVDGASGPLGPGGQGNAAPTGPRSCDTPASQPGAAAIWTLRINPTAGGASVELGKYTPEIGGRSFSVTAARFYITEPILLGSAGSVPVDIVDEAGRPVSYGHQLVDLERPESMTLRLRAPAGRYQGLSLGIGVSAPCNVANPAALEYPLNAGSGMTWSWATGYIWMRLEGRSGGQVFSAHGGSLPDPPNIGPKRVQVSGSIDFPSHGNEEVLEARLDDLLAAAIEGGMHIDAGVAVVQALPTARFLRLPSSP